MKIAGIHSSTRRSVTSPPGRTFLNPERILRLHIKLTMLSFNTGCAVLLLCLAVPSLVSAGGLSKDTLDFLALYQGDFDNWKEILTGGFSDHVPALIKHVPVDIPELSPAPVMYAERVANGKVENMRISVISEHAGPSIHVDLYACTDPSLWKPGQFNVSTLSDLKKEDLRDDNCTAVFRRLAKAVYVGSFPDCIQQLVNGKYPLIGTTYVCDYAGIVWAPNTSTTSTSPYIYQLKGDRYPTIGYPDTYDSICGRD